MRKTKRNPNKFPINSWAYRCIQLRHALGWTQAKLSRVMGVSRNLLINLELGHTTRPTVDTIRQLKMVEKSYADILEQYRKAPVRMDRLRRQSRGRVRLLPIEVRRPKDIESLGEVEADSQPIFFGRGTRRKMPQTGMSLRYKIFLTRRGEAIARGKSKKNATEGCGVPGDTEK